MRECLGWVTNCDNRQACPQNWLELSMAEIPADISCHVCEGRVALVLTEAELEAKAASGLAAFPVVPCTGTPGAPRGPTAHAGARPEPQVERAEPPRQERGPTAAPQNTPQRSWYCTLQSGDAIRLDKDTMIVGRSRTCDVVIPSAKVSRQHASLARVGSDYHIEDLGSANGVWRGGEKVSRTKINDGDVFTISDETLTFDFR